MIDQSRVRRFFQFVSNALRLPGSAALTAANARNTEQKRATDRFRLALEAAPAGMLMLDEAGRIVLVNAQIESLFGYPRAELLGQTIEMLVPERFRGRHPAHRAEFFAVPRMRAMSGGMDLFGLRKDGSEIPVEIGLNPLQTAEGVFVISTIVDISRQRELDRIRSEFISTVSHELRTPLTSISGALGLLQSGAAGVLPEKATTMARMAYRNSERLVRIINDILDIGKLEAGKVGFRCTHIRLSELLQQSLEANTTYADKYGVHFELDDDSGGELAFVDPNRIIQVLTNLLSNAIKFSPRGAAVRIRARPDGAMLRVEIEDSGPGIPEEFQSRIFQKFSQADASTSRRYEGTGLGLSIARKLIEGMGGLIGFSTEIGHGTVFYFEVPTRDPANHTTR
jgi:PAS domain S-box-containing protein